MGYEVFDECLDLSPKRYKVWQYLQRETNWNSYAIYRVVPLFSAILCEPQLATVRACHVPCCPVLFFVTLLYCYCFFERNKLRWNFAHLFSN